MYPPNWHIATDENTAGHKECIEKPSKPTTCGLHIHVSEDCKTGYISSTVPYYWRPTTHSLMRSNLNLSCQVVPQLCKVPLASSRSRHHSHTDRHYASYVLAHQLPKVQTDAALQLQADTKVFQHKQSNSQQQSVTSMHPGTNNIWSDKRLVMMVSPFQSHRQQHTLQRVMDGTFRKSLLWLLLIKLSLTRNTCTRKMCYWWLENILLGVGDTCCEQFQIWTQWSAYTAERISNLNPLKCLYCRKNFEFETNEVPTLQKKLLQLLSGELWNTNAVSCSRSTSRNEISWINSFIFL
jgi:hypothetical protein